MRVSSVRPSLKKLTCPDTFSSIDQHKRDNGHVKLGLDDIVVVFLYIEEVVIRWVADHAGKRHGLREDITRSSMVLSTSITRTVLTRGLQQIEVVAADKVLCQINDGGSQTGFTVVVCSVLTDVTNKLGDLERN